MKKLIAFLLLASLSSCALVARQSQPEQKEQYITPTKNSRMIDLCDDEHMPRFPHRPKLSPKELKNLSDAEMDERIKQHIDALEAHIDILEGVIEKTRHRVQLCR